MMLRRAITVGLMLGLWAACGDDGATEVTLDAEADVVDTQAADTAVAVDTATPPDSTTAPDTATVTDPDTATVTAPDTATDPDTTSFTDTATAPDTSTVDTVVAVDGPSEEVLCGLPSLAEAPGAVYYACDCGEGADPGCVPGDDAATGASPDAALRSYEAVRARFGALAAGDTIALCRGGAFTAGANANWVNAACEAAAPCTVRTYDPGGVDPEARPIVHAPNDVTAFALENGGGAQHEEGYVFAGLDVRGTGSNSFGFFLFNDIDDVDLCDLKVGGFGVGVDVAGGYDPQPGSDARSDRVRLRHSEIVDNAVSGWLGGGDGIVIEDCVFDGNGHAGPTFNHHVYLSNPAGPTSGMRVRRNLLRDGVKVDGACSGALLVAHGVHDDLVIEDNVVWEAPGTAGAGCWGITVDAAYDSSEVFTDVDIRGNVVTDVGNVAIGVSACQGCVIENNVVVQQQGGGVGVAVPTRVPGAGDAVSSDVVVRNNSVYFGVAGQGVTVGEGTGHQIVSNAVHLAQGGVCFDAPVAASTYAVRDHNLCGGPAGTTFAAGAGLAAWQAHSGFDAASVEADPKFTDPASADLSASGASSPLIDAGHPTLSAPTAFGGASRDTAPDIGAHERLP